MDGIEKNFNSRGCQLPLLRLVCHLAIFMALERAHPDYFGAMPYRRVGLVLVSIPAQKTLHRSALDHSKKCSGQLGRGVFSANLWTGTVRELKISISIISIADLLGWGMLILLPLRRSTVVFTPFRQPIAMYAFHLLLKYEILPVSFLTLVLCNVNYG